MNPKKYKADRRKRPQRNVATHTEVLVEKTRKSRAGVEYRYYEKAIVKN